MIPLIFWQRWLFYSSLLFAFFGIVFAVYGNNPLFQPYINALARLIWHQFQMPIEAGGTIACCYILVAFIAWYLFKRKERLTRITAFSPI